MQAHQLPLGLHGKLLRNHNDIIFPRVLLCFLNDGSVQPVGFSAAGTSQNEL